MSRGNSCTVWAVLPFKSCLLFGKLGKWNPLVLSWQAGNSNGRETKKIKHNESQGLGVGCAMFKIKTKDNGWEQIIVTNAKKRIKDLNLISRLWGNFVGGEWVFFDSAKAERWGQVSRQSQKVHTSSVRFECHRYNQEKQRHLGDPGT